jgi:hypothetical protein
MEGQSSIQILRYSVNCSRFPLKLELLGRKLKEVPLLKTVSRAGEVSVTSVVKYVSTAPSILWLVLDRCRRSSAVT